jgi:hypothetical protein
MPQRTCLVGLRLPSLADATVTQDVPLVVMPDGTLRRKQPSAQMVAFGSGYATWTVPAGVTSIDYVLQAGGGGGGGTHETNGVGVGGSDSTLTAGATILRARGGGGAARLSAGIAGTGGSGGTGYDGYPGDASGNGTGGNAGINRVTPARGLGGTRTSTASEGGGGAAGGFSPAYGGGGGECRMGTLAVTPGQILIVNVGFGGATGQSVSGGAGCPGANGFATISYVGI